MSAIEKVRELFLSKAQNLCFFCNLEPHSVICPVPQALKIVETLQQEYEGLHHKFEEKCTEISHLTPENERLKNENSQLEWYATKMKDATADMHTKLEAANDTIKELQHTSTEELKSLLREGLGEIQQGKMPGSVWESNVEAVLNK